MLNQGVMGQRYNKMDLDEKTKDVMRKTFYNKKVSRTRRILTRLRDEKIIEIIHISDQKMFINNLADYEPRVRCSSTVINEQIRKYKPGMVQDATYMRGYERGYNIIFHIFLSEIKARRASTGCIGSRSKIYNCNIAIYECEISMENIEKHLPYTL